jgi:hypothetical protein
MKPTHKLLVFLAALGVASLSPSSLRAEDWKTTDGKVYQDVKVVGLQPDTVTILHQDGGASVPLANLPPDLQKRFNYDPAQAKAAADARAKQALANAKALQAEMDLASEMHQPGPETQDTTAPDPNASPASAKKEIAPTPIFGSATHHSMDDLLASAHTLETDPSDASHRSIDALTASAQAMRPSLTDPTYHTMAHMFYTVNRDGLGPDPSDPNHHTIGEAANAAAASP